MKTYMVNTVLKNYRTSELMETEIILVMTDSDVLDEHVQMMYGHWWDIVSYESVLIDNVHISKTVIEEEARNIMRITFD